MTHKRISSDFPFTFAEGRKLVKSHAVLRIFGNPPSYPRIINMNNSSGDSSTDRSSLKKASSTINASVARSVFYNASLREVSNSRAHVSGIKKQAIGICCLKST